MTQEHEIIQALRRQLAVNEEERAFLENSLREAIARYGNGVVRKELAPPPQRHTARTRRMKEPRRQPNKGQLPKIFEPRPGGPIETIGNIVKQYPGIELADLLDRATAAVESDAKDPRASLRETVRQMVNKGRLRKDHDGSFHVVA